METIDFSDIRPKGASISNGENRSPYEIMEVFHKITENIVISNHALSSYGMYPVYPDEEIIQFLKEKNHA